jgi:hypothetical protein
MQEQSSHAEKDSQRILIKEPIFVQDHSWIDNEYAYDAERNEPIDMHTIHQVEEADSENRAQT